MSSFEGSLQWIWPKGCHFKNTGGSYRKRKWSQWITKSFAGARIWYSWIGVFLTNRITLGMFCLCIFHELSMATCFITKFLIFKFYFVLIIFPHVLFSQYWMDSWECFGNLEWHDTLSCRIFEMIEKHAKEISFFHFKILNWSLVNIFYLRDGGVVQIFYFRKEDIISNILNQFIHFFQNK